jgi:hypothetical protein
MISGFILIMFGGVETYGIDQASLDAIEPTLPKVKAILQPFVKCRDADNTVNTAQLNEDVQTLVVFQACAAHAPYIYFYAITAIFTFFTAVISTYAGFRETKASLYLAAVMIGFNTALLFTAIYIHAEQTNIPAVTLANCTGFENVDKRNIEAGNTVGLLPNTVCAESGPDNRDDVEVAVDWLTAVYSLYGGCAVSLLSMVLAVIILTHSFHEALKREF